MAASVHPGPSVFDRFFETLATLPQGILVSGADHRLVFCNEAFTTATGFTLDDIAGQTCTFMQGPGTSTQTIQEIAAALHAERSLSCEILNYRKDGTEFWNELTLVPRHDEAGQLTNYIGLTRDITAQRRPEASAVLENETVQTVLDYVRSGIVLHRANTEIVYANQAAATLLGVAHDIITGVVSTDPRWAFTYEDGTLMDPADYPVNQVLHTGQPLTGYIVGTRNDTGAPQRFLLCDAYPILDAADRVSEVITSFTEITELKMAQRSMQKSEQRLRLVVQGSNDAAWDWDLLSDEIYYAPRWWEMLGMTPPDTQASPNIWQDLMHPDDAALVSERLATWIASRTDTYEIEFRLRHQDGRYIPMLSRGVISRDTAGKAIRISGANMDLSERKRHEAQLYQLAYHDPLTGLPNRRLLGERLRQTLLKCAAEQITAAVLHIDVDNFKLRNDTLGYDQSDELLQIIASRLKDLESGRDTVARLGGDDFVVILEHPGANAELAGYLAEQAARKILQIISAPFTLGGTTQTITASIGVALSTAQTKNADAILKQAELAMYTAKAAGRGTLRFFDPTMQLAIESRAEMEHDLRAALAHGHITPAYQAKIQDGTGIIGAELLGRWTHPARGMIPPGVFIPFCETNGLILELGRHILTLACRQLAAWATNPAFAGLSLAVNVSVRELQDPDYVSHLCAIVNGTGANPHLLILEITESVLAEDPGLISTKIQDLRALGIKISLDDFGTGYSSLGMLLQLPLDELKIDRTFVAGIPESATACNVAGIIIDLAKQLGLNLVAEGVETAAQLEFLRSRACHVFQGYVFAKPCPLDAFETLVMNTAIT